MTAAVKRVSSFASLPSTAAQRLRTPGRHFGSSGFRCTHVEAAPAHFSRVLSFLPTYVRAARRRSRWQVVVGLPPVCSGKDGVGVAWGGRGDPLPATTVRVASPPESVDETLVAGSEAEIVTLPTFSG